MQPCWKVESEVNNRLNVSRSGYSFWSTKCDVSVCPSHVCVFAETEDEDQPVFRQLHHQKQCVRSVFAVC